jgi:hypothetical protein
MQKHKEKYVEIMVAGKHSNVSETWWGWVGK